MADAQRHSESYSAQIAQYSERAKQYARYEIQLLAENDKLKKADRDSNGHTTQELQTQIENLRIKNE